jgi:hypothetical protein
MPGIGAGRDPYHQKISTLEPSASADAPAGGRQCGHSGQACHPHYGEDYPMASIRIETVADKASGQVYAEVYSGEGSVPVMRSEPAFASHEDLVSQILEMYRAHFPDHTPLAEDPTIGV